MSRRAIIYAAATLLAAALVVRFHDLGGPYFEIPETIQDHVSKVPYPSRDAIVMARRAAEILPRGATVTLFMPSQAPNYDITVTYTAVGFMPHHKIVKPDLGLRPEYVITVREPLAHDAYRLQAEFPEGKIYARK